MQDLGLISETIQYNGSVKYLGGIKEGNVAAISACDYLAKASIQNERSHFYLHVNIIDRLMVALASALKKMAAWILWHRRQFRVATLSSDPCSWPSLNLGG